MIDTPGIHHVTAIANEPQANVAFYTEILGLRLVKRTVNFDDKFTHHLYYGDAVGTPGTTITFFPFQHGRAGQVGRGQVQATAFAIPESAIEFWVDWLTDREIEVTEATSRFDEPVLSFHDHDGLPLELVASDTDIEPWHDGPVPPAVAIRGFHGITIDSYDTEASGEVLALLGYEETATDGDLIRYRAHGDRAAVVDLRGDMDAPRGRQGVGTVHHVAFRVDDEATQLAWRERLLEAGLSVTPQKDRRYFTSIYFREPGGVLFEIATDGPGFTRDEAAGDLGAGLMLPPWLEEDRTMIEAQFPPLSVGATTTDE